MPTLVNNNTLFFNGAASIADQFSGIGDMRGVGNTSRGKVAFYFQVETSNLSAGGVMGITLQFNPNVSTADVSPYGWVDEARTSLTILNTTTCTNLAQTNAAIDSSKLRGGIIVSAGIGVYPLLFSFEPSPLAYRLRFQLNSSMNATIPAIVFTT